MSSQRGQNQEIINRAVNITLGVVMKIMLYMCLVLSVIIIGETQAKNNMAEPDANQKQYLQQLIANSNEILKLEEEYITNYRRIRSQRQLEMLELKSRGRVPSNVEMDGQNLEKENARILSEQSRLEKDRENIKLDTLKFYKGKIPRWLDEKWDSEDHRFITERIKIIEKMNTELVINSILGKATQSGFMVFCI